MTQKVALKNNLNRIQKFCFWGWTWDFKVSFLISAWQDVGSSRATVGRCGGVFHRRLSLGPQNLRPVVPPGVRKVLPRRVQTTQSTRSRRCEYRQFEFPPIFSSGCINYLHQVTGEPLVRRADDNPETLKKRLKAYHSQTSPLVDYYSNKKIHSAVDASTDPKSIFTSITAIFDGMKGRIISTLNCLRTTICQFCLFSDVIDTTGSR